MWEIQCARCLHKINEISNIFCRTSKQAVEEQRKQESQYSGDVDVVRNRVQEIQNELENVIEQLGEAKVSSYSDGIEAHIIRLSSLIKVDKIVIVPRA